MSDLKAIESVSELKGSRKAAALLLSLPPDYVSKIFKELDDNEIRELSQLMSTLGRVKAEVVEGLYVDFAEQVSSTGALMGSFESTERLLKQVLEGDRAKGIMDEIRGPAGRTIWDKLCNVDEEVLANFLKNEYPQTVAVVIANIRSDHAARVIGKLPEAFSAEVIHRLLKMDVVQRDILDTIETTLRTEFMSNLAKTSKRDSHEIMAEIFNAFDRSTETKFMEKIEDKAPDSAEKIKALMFTFDDLIKLDASGAQTLIRVADKSKLALALKGSADNIKDLFFSNMSERAGKLLKEDIQSLGMVRLKDVEDSQLEIVMQAKDLADKGEITITEGGEDEEYI